MSHLQHQLHIAVQEPALDEEARLRIDLFMYTGAGPMHIYVLI